MNITVLGEAKFESPIGHSVSDSLLIPENIVIDPASTAKDDLKFELAGPRSKLFFDPKNTRAGIVTCGGLCPGLNNVIRSLFLELHHAYGVKQVIGFRGGYQGLDPVNGKEPVVLTPKFVHSIHKEGGTVLGTSRGPVDIRIAVDNLIQREVNMIFTVGGDGTQRGGNELFQEAKKRGYPLAVVGVPKTIDNDVAFVTRTFGYMTAVSEASKVLSNAHNEAISVENGIALVKLMGRNAGFVAAGATIACQDVNFALLPEVAFKLEGPNGFLAALKKRVLERSHALVVVAEGAGQDLFTADEMKKDDSGNIKAKDIGVFLRDTIGKYFKNENIPVVIRYIDPSYIVRSSAANSEDAILCDMFARNAVHAAMAGKTGLVIGYMHDRFIHVPIDLLTSRKKSMDPLSFQWKAVQASTGQVAQFK
ncbi:ATP-dependent 6-phosphofructokinase [Pinibacter soli]|uniref:ATP-dependent 6-phosphofructokinase n=1 Tax=Pinibacter soli TaxID=3044211 RepID=A0ABT6RG66_9BACT|nr:ATP-dependent 6-phosphofructokinase [Pinibacter soli]MDI3321451.1 ATP-dependent 6-phosphofructokinase [Pinibacter soli]